VKQDNSGFWDGQIRDRTDDFINLLAPLGANLWPNSAKADRSMNATARLDTAR